MWEFDGRHLEREITLAVVSFQAPELLARLAACDRVGCFTFGPSKEYQLHDVYFDTKERELTRNRWALRKRFTADGCMLTLKGPPRAIGPGGVERVELEAPCSLEVIHKAIQVLAQEGIAALPSGKLSDHNDATRLLQAIFDVIQDRQTFRVSRSVALDEQEIPLGDIAFDRVIYDINSVRVVHAEIEIEARSELSYEMLALFANQLCLFFPRELRPWPFGKLATGYGLEKLSCDGTLAGYRDREGMLVPTAYDALLRVLNNLEVIS